LDTSGNFPIPSNTETPIPFDRIRFDGPGGAMYDPMQPTRLTAQVAGRYQISGAVVWRLDQLGGTIRSVALRVNGFQNIAMLTSQPFNTGTAQSISTLFELAIGDFVELVVVQNDPVNAVDVVKFVGLALEAISPELMMTMVSPL
jgi:hypothetical protein